MSGVLWKIVNDKSWTIIFPVGDLKMSEVDSNIVASVLAEIGAEYRKMVKITITRGKIHKYLGMTINYSLPEKWILSMVNYMVKMLYDTPEDMKGESATPFAHHFLYLAEDATTLSQTGAESFHHFLAQILYLS